MGQLFRARTGGIVETHEWDEASQRRLEESAATADILHIATHAYRLDPECLPALPRNALHLVGIQLAGAARVRPERSRHDDDGLFSGDELSRLDLHRAHLVVLSGCSTAQVAPTSSRGERLSLPDAAWIAGAETIVATLWSVRDEAMPEDVAVYYEAWLSGLSPARALQQGLREARERTRRERGHTHPAYWAATVIEGS